MSDERPPAPPGDGTNGPEAALPSTPDASPPEPQTSAEPPAEDKPPELGLCVRCQKRIPVALLFDVAGQKHHRRGAKLLGEACGPVVTRWIYHVTGWMIVPFTLAPNLKPIPLSIPFWDIVEMSNPLEANVAGELNGLEAYISAQQWAKDRQTGALVLGVKPRVVVWNWTQLGAR